MYNLHTLGWSDFQRLCLTISRTVLGQTVQSFLDSGDGGRDGAFAGTWKPSGGEALRGQFVIQCKFTGKSDHSLQLSDLTDEVAKVKRLVKKRRCDIYVLLTNAGVSGAREEEVQDLFKNAGAKHVVVFGANWISDQIRENKRLRMLVPRVYGLGDLSQILDARAYAQARAILELMREDLAKVVVTDAYRRAAASLDKHSFVLLVGEPAAGKTTIASLLGMAAVDQWNASMMKLDDPAKVVEHWNPDEPSQFFWVDDAFGVMQYEEFLVHGWNHALPQIKTMLRKGAKIVMTSRDYIYNSARKDLKESAFPLMKESQVVIDVHQLTPEEKRQILYNHLKLGKQPLSFRSDIKPYLERVAAHPRFIPETARRLSDPLFTKGLFIDGYYLERFVEKREQLLEEVLTGLDRDSKAALALIYMRNDRLGSPIALQPSESDALERLGSSLGGCTSALEALSGSLVLLTQDNGDALWKFKHPTIGDAYASILVHSPELLGIYIRGSAPEKLVEQVTCGDVGIEKAVVIPRVLFPLMLERLREISKSKDYKSAHLAFWGGKWALHGFLARRCSREFLDLFIASDPTFLDRISAPGLMLSAMSEVGLVVSLHRQGLLPEANRLKFVSTISQYAIDGNDLGALSSKSIRSVSTHDEFETLKKRVRSELFPRLDEVRQNVESNYHSGTAEEHMSSLIEAFATLKREFADDDEAVKIIDRETKYANWWIGDHTNEEPERKERKLGKVSEAKGRPGARSVFDDIDDDGDVGEADDSVDS
jgi:hypothetical protein